MKIDKPEEKYIKSLEEIQEELESLDEYTAENMKDIESVRKSVEQLAMAIRSIINGDNDSAETYLLRAESDIYD